MNDMKNDDGDDDDDATASAKQYPTYEHLGLGASPGTKLRHFPGGNTTKILWTKIPAKKCSRPTHTECTPVL